MARRRSAKPQPPFAQRLETIRVTYGVATNRPDLTKKDFAKLLGLEPETYSTYERGISYPNVETLQRLYDLTNISLDWLICGVSERRPQLVAPPRLRIAHRRQAH